MREKRKPAIITLRARRSFLLSLSPFLLLSLALSPLGLDRRTDDIVALLTQQNTRIDRLPNGETTTAHANE